MNAQVRYRPMRRTDLAVRVCLGRVNQKKPFCGHVMSEASRLSNDSVLLPTLYRHSQKGSTLDIFQIKPTCLPRYSHSPFSYNHLGHACSLFIHNLGHAWSLFRPSLGPQQFTIINLHVKLLLQNPPTTGHLSASKFQPIFAKLRKLPISYYTIMRMQPSFILVPQITSKCPQSINSI